ncbi:MAG: hypothetical protein Q8L27_01620 [archaeon]|nr:hypothetical protein [archaeon]
MLNMLNKLRIMKMENPSLRAPTLETVLMIEEIIEKNSGEFNRTELWKKLPKKVMWQTYLIVLDYLQSVNKIAVDSKGVIGFIWNPKFANKFVNRKRY